MNFCRTPPPPSLQFVSGATGVTWLVSIQGNIKKLCIAIPPCYLTSNTSREKNMFLESMDNHLSGENVVPSLCLCLGGLGGGGVPPEH